MVFLVRFVFEGLRGVRRLDYLKSWGRFVFFLVEVLRFCRFFWSFRRFGEG